MLVLFVITVHCFPIFPVDGILMDRKKSLLLSNFTLGYNLLLPTIYCCIPDNSVQKSQTDHTNIFFLQKFDGQSKDTIQWLKNLTFATPITRVS